MARRRTPSPIGLSMLDLISNSLAAVIILFIVLAAQRIPPIPPERMKGVLLVRLELVDSAATDTARSNSEPWVFAPEYVNKVPGAMRQHWRLHGREIQESMSTEARFYGKWTSCDSLYLYHGFPKQFSPCAMSYNGKGQPNVHYLLFRDPIPDQWSFGLTFVEHWDLDSIQVPRSVTMELWWMTETAYFHPDIQKIKLDAPTYWAGWSVDFTEAASRKMIGPNPIL